MPAVNGRLERAFKCLDGLSGPGLRASRALKRKKTNGAIYDGGHKSPPLPSVDSTRRHSDSAGFCSHVSFALLSPAVDPQQGGSQIQ